VIQRKSLLNTIEVAFAVNPVCALLGPRQSGKTTLAKTYISHHGGKATYFDLEDPTDLSKLDTPKLAFTETADIIVIDEVQRRPELFPWLRVFVDKNPHIKILVLGSASGELIKQSSETLAGRISHIEVTPFSIQEVGMNQEIWNRGGFPKSYLAKTEEISSIWRKEYIRTFLENDIKNLGFDISSQTLRRFWSMLAHYHGQIFNGSEIGRSIDVTNKTSNRYLDILVSTFMIRRLNPWFENIGKRQIKSPKIYFRDTGLLHSILGIADKTALMSHPKLGSSWEGFAIEQVIKSLKVREEDCYFWATSSGAELDLLVLKDGKRIGFEFKYTDAPKVTKSMHISLSDLKLDELFVVIPGDSHFRLSEAITVKGLSNFV